MEERGRTERLLIEPGLRFICAWLNKRRSEMNVQEYSNEEHTQPWAWMWIHLMSRLVFTGMTWSEMRNRRDAVESKFLCSMIPCFSTIDCMHQGDDVNVVIVLEWEQNLFFICGL